MSALRRAAVVASDETGVRIEGSNADHWAKRARAHARRSLVGWHAKGFRSAAAVVHQASPTRAPSWWRK